MLSDFAKDIRNNSTICDLCSGTGIISILLSSKTNAKKIYAVEIQEAVANMSKRSVLLNNLENKIEVLNMDLNNLNKEFNSCSFDAIVTNPPYKKLETGLTNSNNQKLISRHEVLCDLEDIISTSSYLLKSTGSFYMVHRPDRLADIMCLLRKYNLEPKILRFVQPFHNKAPNMLLIKAIKNAKSFLKLQEPLIVYNENNTYTDEILKIYSRRK